jgi:hypothetical protein
MPTIEQRLYRRNLETAWALAGTWSWAHQEQLADLVVEEFIRAPEQRHHDS